MRERYKKSKREKGKKENTLEKGARREQMRIKNRKYEMRKIHVPSNRYNPLKENWVKILTPIVEYLKLQVRFNLKTRNVEIKVKYFQVSN